MKNTMKRLLCLLLALCMCAGLALGAAAEDEEDGTGSGAADSGEGGGNGGNDTDDGNGGGDGGETDAPESYGQISIRDAEISAFYGDTITLDYTISPKDYSGSVIWSSSDESIATVADGEVSITREGSGTRTVTITAALDDGGGDEDSCEITVSENSVTGFTVSSPDCTIGSGALKLKGRASFTLEGTTTYKSGPADDKKGASWGEIGNIYVVTRENDSGKFVTVGPGTTTVEVICPYDPGRAQVLTVTVEDAPLTGLSISGTGVSNGGVTLGNGGSLTLSAAKVPSNTFDENSITWRSSDPGVASVNESTGAVTALKSGSATITAECGRISASVRVTVSAPSTAISASTSRSQQLSFSGVYSELARIYRACYGKDPASDTTVTFTSTGNAGTGILYTSAGNAVSRNSTAKLSDVKNFYFVPGAVGSCQLGYSFTADGVTIPGTITVSVTALKTRNITIKLRDDSAYAFSSTATTDKISAESAISSAIKDASGKAYTYIIFDTSSISSASQRVGTLYPNSMKNSALGDYRSYIAARSGTAQQSPVSKLYFEPKKEGTYSIGYTAYDASGELCSGELIIEVGAASDSSGGMDIYFNTTSGSTLSLGESVFESWFRKEKGSNYNLAYVTFDSASRSFGSFKHSGSAFEPGNDARYYTQGFTGSTGSGPKYLDNVNFTAPGSTGYVSVDFTCCGGTSSSGTSTRVSGTFYIFVTRDSVKGVTLDVAYGSDVTLSESEFAAVHKNAMSLSSSSSPRYYIELLEVPSKGTLYYNYTNAGKPGTRLISSNFDGFDFYVNSTGSYDSVSDLTYVPANASSGTVSVRYLARATDGEPMYVGSVSFSYGKQSGGSALSCGAEGYAFKTSDFPSGSASDPVAYVTFSQPKSGVLMLGYANGRGVPLDSSVRLYTSNRTDGSYPISSLSYIPKAGFSGNVDIAYTAVTRAGKAQSGVMTIAVSSRKGSAHFRDVKSTGSGAWASDAIDFAYKWGLVNGTGEDTFSPDSTMTRAMLVTILYRSAASPKVSGSCPFSDVAAGTYYYDAVIWAANSGIVTGTTETTFSPNNDVNREQVAAFLHRYAKYNGENVAAGGSLSGYVDKSFVSPYAVEPMRWAVQHGYITSNSDTELMLSPGGNATRAQVAVMLHRFLTY